LDREQNLANLVTLLRFPLMIVLVVLLNLGQPGVSLACVPFLIVIILMDTLDGSLARRRGETSLLGSAFDIAADRTLELILWVVFAKLGLISVWVPIIVIIRGVTVDAVRAVGISQGIPPFNQLANPLSRFLVGSKVMRTLYSISKAFAFNLLIIDLALKEFNHPWAGWVDVTALVLTWLAVAICVARGVPVLVSGADLLNRSGRSLPAGTRPESLD
jgi:CDP-diacylglycerol---glycerol-3-phosphate 3-phosphatidyltransferase